MPLIAAANLLIFASEMILFAFIVARLVPVDWNHVVKVGLIGFAATFIAWALPIERVFGATLIDGWFAPWDWWAAAIGVLVIALPAACLAEATRK